jgi:hypothetical protein
VILRNEDILKIVLEVPEGHRHLRTTIYLQDGGEIVLQEATVANLVRAFVSIKSHPLKRKIILKGRKVDERKEGFAEWQLVED